MILAYIFTRFHLSCMSVGFGDVEFVGLLWDCCIEESLEEWGCAFFLPCEYRDGEMALFFHVPLFSLLAAPSSQPVGEAFWVFLEEPLKQQSSGGVGAGMPC